MANVLPVELLENGPERLARAVLDALDQEAYIDGLVSVGVTEHEVAMRLIDIACALENEHDSRSTIYREAEGFLDGSLLGLHSIDLTLPSGTLDRMSVAEICKLETDNEGRQVINENQMNLLIRRARAGYESTPPFDEFLNNWQVPSGEGSRMQRLYMKLGFGAVMWKLGIADDWDKWAASLKL